jgi:hypothetical protein
MLPCDGRRRRDVSFIIVMHSAFAFCAVPYVLVVENHGLRGEIPLA